jgi:hypothetical protein
LCELVGEMALRLLLRTTAALVSADQGFVCVDLDNFAMDDSGTRKEHVGRTYQGFDSYYRPIAAYIGNEGWCLGLELRSDTQQSTLKTDYFLDRIFPHLQRLAPAPQPSLYRLDKRL